MEIIKEQLDLKLIGENITTLLEYNGKEKKAYFARKVHVAVSLPGKWQRGERPPSQKSLELIADHFHITVNDLVSTKITFEYLDKLNQAVSFVNGEVLDDIFIGVKIDSSKANADYSHADFLYRQLFIEDTDEEDLIIDKESFYDVKKSFIDSIRSCREYYYKSFKDSNILAGAVNTLKLILIEYIFSLIEIPENYIEKISKNQFLNADLNILIYETFDKTCTEKSRELVTKNEDVFVDCLKALKNDEKTIDLYEYYLLLKYLCGFVSEISTFEENINIASKLLIDYLKLENPYVETFIDLYVDLSSI